MSGEQWDTCLVYTTKTDLCPHGTYRLLGEGLDNQVKYSEHFTIMRYSIKKQIGSISK